MTNAFASCSMHGTPLLSAKGNHDQEYNSGASDYDDHYKPTNNQQPAPPPFNGAQQHYPPPQQAPPQAPPGLPPQQQALLPPPPAPPQQSGFQAPDKAMSDSQRNDSKSIGEMGNPVILHH